MQMKKKSWIIAVAVGIAMLGILLLSMTKKSEVSDVAKKYDETDITRYEWLQKLCQYSGMVDYSQETPYFNDVDTENEFFGVVQAAVEWGLISEDDDFMGNEKASGRFVALTAMRSIGEDKLQIYSGTSGKIGVQDYLDIAIENQLINKSQLERGISLDEANNVLKRLDELYFSVFWPTELEYIEYREDVIELSDFEVVYYDEEKAEIYLDDVDLSVGDVITFHDGEFVVARKVSKVNAEGEYELVIPELEEIVETLVESNTEELSFQDIINYYGEENLILVNNDSNQQFVTVSKTISGEAKTKGFKIEAKEDNKQLKVLVTNNDTGVTYQLPITKTLSDEYSEFDVSLDINNIFVGAQVKYSSSSGVEFADVAVDINSEFKGGLSAENKIGERLILFETPAPLGCGAIGVDVQICLVMTLEGEIYLEAELPFQNTVHYEKGKGIRNIDHEFSIKDPKIEASAEITTKIRVAPILVAFEAIPLLDAEFDMGVSARAQIELRENQICADVGIAFPIVDILVGDEEVKYYGKESLLSKMHITGEWNLIEFENAPQKYNLHFEKLSDGTKQFVDECTYGKRAEIEEETEDDPTLSALLKGDYSEFAGNYLPCKALHNWYGEGKDVAGLTLQTDGTITGAGAEQLNLLMNYPPISVTKDEKGAYVCTLTESDYYYDEGAQTYFPENPIITLVIYPKGVVGSGLYGEDEQFLKNCVYINYIAIGGGVLDVAFYLEDNVSDSMEGLDWVSQDDYSNEVGDTFLSGTGVEYEVIGIEQNFDSGRERIVLFSQDGKKMMISNLPNFYIHPETNEVIFYIEEYASSPHYEKYL